GRRGYLAAALIREQGRNGDVAGARATATATLTALGENSPFASEVLTALGTAERKAGKYDAAATALRTAIALAAQSGNGRSDADRHAELGDGVAGRGKTADAKAALKAGVALAERDPKAQTKASAVALKLKEPAEAVARARRAVELTQGEDAPAQAALAS